MCVCVCVLEWSTLGKNFLGGIRSAIRRRRDKKIADLYSGLRTEDI